MLSALVLTGAALIAATLFVSLVLQRFVTGQIDQRLDRTINDVAESLEAGDGGQLHMRTRGEAPDFQRLGSGWYWQVESGNVFFRSPSLGDKTLEAPPAPVDWRSLFARQPGKARLAQRPGEDLHMRVRSVMVGQKLLTISASAPQVAIDGPLREALLALVPAMAVLALLLIAATILQVRVGLSPLRRLRESVRNLAAGAMQRLPEERSPELRPLVEELNALAARNEERLAAARRHSANLAHSLKTPLATLSLELANSGAAPQVTTLVEDMERKIRHHLGRARMAVLGQHNHQSIAVATHVADIAEALARIYVERQISITIAVQPDVTAGCDGQDFDEMLGNLLDNAYKWARSRIGIAAERHGATTKITIDDDGPGLSPDKANEMVQPGRRLDETTPGHGFGLSIVTEIAELYGGALTLSSGPLGGLRAALVLPR